MIRCILLATLAVHLVLAVSSANTTELPPAEIDASLVKNFAKINDYLEKKVDSDNLEANMEGAKKWLKEKSKLSLIFDRSLTRALQIFVSLPRVIENVSICKYLTSRKLLEKWDEGLADEAHLNTNNYPLKRIDRLLESVAYKYARLCRFLPGKVQHRTMNFAFKQLAYDHINEDLINGTSDLDPEINLGVAGDILRALNNQPDGSYALALKQLLALKSISTKDSCNEKSTEIVLRNDFATRGEAHTSNTPLRRISKIVHHYLVEHSSVCHPIYRMNCLALLEQLDLQTYRKVLALVSAHFLTQFDEINGQVNRKQVSQDFTIQLISENDIKQFRIYDSIALPSKKLLPYLRAITEQDPRSRFLGQVVDEKCGKLVLMEDKIKELYNEYIYKPCERFHRLMGSDIDVFDYHNWRLINTTNDTAANEPLNFRLLHTAVYACRPLLDYHDYYIGGLIEKLKRGD